MRALLLAACICAPALGQETLRARLHPITAPIRNAGVYHVATGTWTRGASLANVVGPDIIYNNTCAPSYYVAPMQLGELYQHRSRIPSTTGPTTPGVYYGTARNDEAPGCHDAYTVNGFQVAYCSSAPSTVDWEYDFASSYLLCASGDMVPQYTVLVTGLPGGGPAGAQNCWVVDIDVSGNTAGGLVLDADGDGTYIGPSSQETFGFGFGPASAVTLADGTGPVIAGNYTSTAGGSVPCAGTDGTIWDNPINLSEPGTGMSSSDFFRITGASPSVPPGCYFGNGTIHADFYLKLYANVGCPSCLGMCGPQEFCFPGEGATRACTTCVPANPPSAHGRGCNNYGQVTGGAHITETGSTQVSHDTVVFTSSFENNTAFTILMQGTATANQVFGAGIRCVSGILKRVYTGPAGSAANGDPAGVFHRPGPVDTRSVHQASLDAGYDIGAHAPITLFYMAYYRDPLASAHCNGATFNASQGVGANWIP
ncbi:MAG TPA: hypothetical protein VGR31_03295 [Planctomycetota bacterium]|jgi:hypothetical protein|nr:hypothetical protein [Planctomycetota bacterium]